MDNIFLPQTQPMIDAVLNSINFIRIDPIFKQLSGGAAIEADELFTNADANISYIGLIINLYNNEGSNRTLSLLNSAGNTIFITASIANSTSQILSGLYVLYFSKLDASALLAGANTTLTFTGYRVVS